MKDCSPKMASSVTFRLCSRDPTLLLVVIYVNVMGVVVTCCCHLCNSMGVMVTCCCHLPTLWVCWSPQFGCLGINYLLK